MAVCAQCGSEPVAGAVFCHHCGQALVANTESVPPLLQAPPAKRRKGLDVALLLINLVLYAAIHAGLIFVVPVFAAMFADFGAALPTSTQLLIDSASFWKSHSLLLNPLSALLVCGVIYLALKRSDLRGWFVLAAVLQALLLIAMTIALFLPIAELGAVAGDLK